MKIPYGFFFSCLMFLTSTAWGREVPVLTVADTINPGSGDYLIQGLQSAERENAPFVVIKLDTPGGLLGTTRQIIQQMLNTKVPVVVFVGPRGAHAGSAGALISFAADVTVMAPGTNLGAAHPVSGTGGSLDKTMAEKVTNDTAAFAESLARTKGRNSAWAIKSVKESASITSEVALKENVIDFIASDTDELLAKLSNYKLKAAKGSLTSLPQDTYTAKPVEPSIKHRLVAFFADPNLAYLILTLGGLCLWIELSHPGLVIPGVLGGICLILSLVSFQTLPISYGALALILIGMGALVAELYLPTFGILGLGGLASFIIGSLFLMDTQSPEFQIPLTLILPMAAVLAGSAFVIGYLVIESRKTKNRSGVEALVGEYGEVREPISKQPGKIFVQGELWNAVSKTGDELARGEVVIVSEVKNMLLVVGKR